MNKRQSCPLILVASVDEFHHPLEPSVGIGTVVRLNSGGPLMVVVDLNGETVVTAWGDTEGVQEQSFPAASVHRVGPDQWTR
jgi:uncharacterized protein YodC (DUF2158 family)